MQELQTQARCLYGGQLRGCCGWRLTGIDGEVADRSRCPAEGCEMRDASSRELHEAAQTKTGVNVEAQHNAGRGTGLRSRWV